MDGVAAQPLRAEEKGDRGLELRRQEEHLEVEEGLLVHREVGLAWRTGHTADSERFPAGSLAPGRSPVCFEDLQGRMKGALDSG